MHKSNRSTSLDDVTPVLFSIPPHDRDIWVKCSMALKSEFGDVAFPLWDNWSQQADSYKESDARAVWKSCKGNGVNLGTLYHLAKQNGWQSNKPVVTPKLKPVPPIQTVQTDNEEVIKRAKHIWDHSEYIRPPCDHPYAVDKDIDPWGARLYKDSLVIPVYEKLYSLVGLQFIDKDGKKKFLTGTQKKGNFSFANHLEEYYPSSLRTLYICEGFATACTLYHEYGEPVFIAFDAGNLLPVAEKIRELYPTNDIVIAADNDHRKDKNVGLINGIKAANSIGAKLIYPDFTQWDNPEGKSDFNDFVALGGVI